ncbi:MAG: permease [Deltaproteobacteria bacterium]|nr:permease [Deltaproteobacteria bacterium]
MQTINLDITHILSILHFSPSYYLVLSVVSLFAGPAFFALIKNKAAFIELIDGFTLVVVTYLVTVHLLPHVIAEIGLVAVVITFLGVLLPTFFEKKLHVSFAHKAHKFTLLLTLVGICFHEFTDGVALINPSMPHTPDTITSVSLLPIAVILHRLPVGLIFWLILRPVYGNHKTILFLCIMALFTIAGFFAGNMALANLELKYFGYFEALIAGALLHVMFHRHEHPSHNPHKAENTTRADTMQKLMPKHVKKTFQGSTHQTSSTQWQWSSSTGAILGIALVIFLLVSSGKTHAHSLSHETSFFSVFIMLSSKSAAALVAAYVFSGLLYTLLPPQSMAWMHKGSVFLQSLKGMAFGLPLPICSCGVVPIYRTLIKKGAPLASAIAFFVATPELGIDALLLTIPLLGTKFALIRLVCAALVALVIGLIIGVFFQTKHSEEHSPHSDPVIHKSFYQKIKEGLKTGLVDSVDHTAPWIVLGLVLAAVAHPYLTDSGIMKSIPPSLQIPLFALLGMPVYVCATGATPFVAVLIYAGVSPGAAIAFLLTGPATNVTTFGLLSQLHGKALASVFAILMALLSISLGYLVNAISPVISMTPPETLQHSENHYLGMFFLLILSIIYLLCLMRRGPRFLINQIVAFDTRRDDGHDCCANDSCCESNNSKHSHIKQECCQESNNTKHECCQKK